MRNLSSKNSLLKGKERLFLRNFGSSFLLKEKNKKMDVLDESKYDKQQIELMEELCIVVDEKDKAIGYGTKKECK